MTYGKLTNKQKQQVKTGAVKNFVWQGCEYTFDPETGMIGGHMEFHIAHATLEMSKYVASVFPSEV